MGGAGWGDSRPERPREIPIVVRSVPQARGGQRAHSNGPCQSMQIATRLVLALGIAVSIVMAAYGVIALRQREAILADALVRETDTLARALQITADNALRDERLEDLDRVLARVAEDPETLAAAVLGERGRVLAGGPAEAVACLERYRPLASYLAELRGWADCDGRTRWVVLETRLPGSVLVVARRATVLELDMAASRWRMFYTTLALAAAAALAILLVLRKTLSAPLAQVMEGVRTLGGPLPPSPVEVPRSAGEIGRLAAAFNEMAERLEAKRQSLLREVDERIALERRLRRSEKFAALGRLTGGMAHELGSPLNVIGVRAEAVLSDPDAPPFSRRQAEEILAEVERVAALIRDLSKVARSHGMEPVPVDLREVARSVAADVRSRAEEISARLEMEAPETPVLVLGDAALLRHALHNLATNALQSLSEKDGERWLAIRVGEEKEEAVIIVEDNGPGIAAPDLARVLDPFFTTKDVGSGMGLGLAMSLGIMEEHDGRLHVEPRKGGGVRATMALPRVTATAGGVG